MLALGIDAGGTKCAFALCDENENIIKTLTLGPANPNDTGIDACLDTIKKGALLVCEGCSPNTVFAGVSGAGSGENKEKIGALLASLFPNSVTNNGTDAVNLLYCSKSTGSVGALICGTGTSLFVRKNNEIHKLGGFGHLFEKGGSAFDFGRDALSLLLLAEEEAEHEKSLAPLEYPLFSLLHKELDGEARDNINKLYSLGKTYIASLAPIVLEAVAQSDGIAKKILDENTDILARRIALAVKRYGKLDEITCGGGLFNSDLFFDTLSAKSEIKLIRSTVPPVVGACRRALLELER